MNVGGTRQHGVYLYVCACMRVILLRVHSVVTCLAGVHQHVDAAPHSEVERAKGRGQRPLPTARGESPDRYVSSTDQCVRYDLNVVQITNSCAPGRWHDNFVFIIDDW